MLNVIKNSGLKIKYTRGFIVDILKAHKEEHIKEFNEAVTEYRRQLKEKSNEFRRLLDRSGNLEPFSMKTKNFGLEVPVNNVDKYDALIEVFSNSTEAEIELEFEVANSIINNDWDFISISKSLFASYKK